MQQGAGYRVVVLFVGWLGRWTGTKNGLGHKWLVGLFEAVEVDMGH